MKFFKRIKLKERILFSGALFFIISYYFFQPVFLIESDKKILFSKTAQSGQKFSTRFIHSVQKTPVEEFFIINDDCDGFILKSTRYQSFGVGLPFLETDGNFKNEGNFFIMDEINRSIKILELRTGLNTELTLKIDEKILPLHEKFSAGSLIRIKILLRYKLLKEFF